MAIFVDARLAHDDEATQHRFQQTGVEYPSRLGEFQFFNAGSGTHVQLIEPVNPCVAIGHVSEPGFLLALARLVYGRCPPSWLITVPATDLSLGESLSPTTGRGMEVALKQIRILLEQGTEAERCTRSA
jgi:hypothetical protein